MTHVVVQACFGCKYTDCVVVCPVECFYEGEQMLYIHPDECIDCEACVPECPVEAIFHQDNVPEDQKLFIELNAARAPSSISNCSAISVFSFSARSFANSAIKSAASLAPPPEAPCAIPVPIS